MSEPREIVLATRSAGKIRELIPMVRDAGLVPLTLEALGIAVVPEEDAIEAFDTFEENALAKARWFSARAGGRFVLADDSGLSVDALGGAPGVRSKRWSAEPDLDGQALDDSNNRKLIRELAGRSDRRARYVCVVVIAGSGGEYSARGECAGAILLEGRGENGFGYDPFFLSDELGVTFGEASIEAKERISHRGRAVRAAVSLCANALAKKNV
jgi:XTP/dITP diphosphohydrolase